MVLVLTAVTALSTAKMTQRVKHRKRKERLKKVGIVSMIGDTCMI